MRFALINTDYTAFLDSLYDSHVGLRHAGYDEQMKVRNESLFGVADFYSSHLRELGHEAHDLHFNNQHMQLAWAREHGIRPRRLDWKTMLRRKRRWPSHVAEAVLEAQLLHYRPDIVFNMDPVAIGPGFWARTERVWRLLVGQHASPIPPGIDFACYDLMTSSLPNLVERFRAEGIRACLFRLGFEPRILDVLGDVEPGDLADVSFVGTVSSFHERRVRWLEGLCRVVPGLKVWAAGAESLDEGSPILSVQQGPVWGKDMYRVLRGSRVTLNFHIGVSEGHANNMRLYEATGVGALLITDRAKGLDKLFEIGTQVAAFSDDDECVRQIRHYLDHENDRASVAAAGQARTVDEHSYAARAAELVEIVSALL